ncbi:hypothetical protein ACWT_1086 [Actinoplanes sp. SE50]|uniref:hypothetical protein n=1 Tax=unclassified Actinoplanes TaxID=2626549 RepID=UPI00023ECDEE|nr:MULTISPECIES: hypothetical protein [unclassified Actinoplanes]AEV82102.1 hypothetical protein ACPL_1205 [Actinoplanes sp. SE50/110]ATO80501.1 hypothetical protein ACWT_1086 [Actinoplanes sp. SE50]
MVLSERTAGYDDPGEPGRMIEYTAAMCGETLTGAARPGAGPDDFCSRVAVTCGPAPATEEGPSRGGPFPVLCAA